MFNQYSLHLGIASFLPLAYGLIDDKDELERAIQELTDETTMLCKHGLRSLSAKDQFFQIDSNLYRGNVFIHLNYLVLRGLKKFYDKDIAAQEAYRLIRSRLIDTVYKSWKQDHLFWEMYDQGTGEGLGSAPFNGWTSLVLLIEAELYH